MLRLPDPAISAVASAELPVALVRSTGSLGDSEEGSRVATEGRLLEKPVAVADGLAADFDDGSGAVRLIVSAEDRSAGLVTGAQIRVIGPLGQRDSGDGGGYRVYALEAGDLEVLAPPPTPTPKPSPTPDARRRPRFRPRRSSPARRRAPRRRPSRSATAEAERNAEAIGVGLARHPLSRSPTPGPQRSAPWCTSSASSRSRPAASGHCR